MEYKNKKAFTLLEVLTAMAIMTALTLLTIRATTYLVTLYDDTTSTTHTRTTLNQTFRLITPELESLARSPNSLKTSPNKLAFYYHAPDSNTPHYLQYTLENTTLYRTNYLNQKEPIATNITDFNATPTPQALHLTLNNQTRTILIK